jgi:putative hydrolase of the HAD superfamily
MSSVIVLDVDDTVYLERDFAISGYRHLDRWITASYGVGGFAEACTGLLDAGERGHIFDRALTQLGIAANSDIISELVERYRTHPPDIQLAADAERFLKCDGRSFRLGLITDGLADTQLGKINALGLDHLVDKAIVTGRWPPGQGKPHPRAFEEMEAWSQLPPQRHVYVGDNAAKDFVTPKARGWLTVQIVRPLRLHTAEPADDRYAAHATIASFDELLITLSKLGPLQFSR